MHRRANSERDGQACFHQRSISSRLLPLVSGVNRQTKKKVNAHIVAYTQNAPETEMARTSDRKVNVIHRHAIHKLIVATDMARPRMLVGNSSDINTHTVGPIPTDKHPAWHSTRAMIICVDP